MSYRDDLEAAQARADAQQRRADQLEEELARVERERVELARVEQAIPVVPPPIVVAVAAWQPEPIRDASSDKAIGSLVGSGLIFVTAGAIEASLGFVAAGLAFFAIGIPLWILSARKVAARPDEICYVEGGRRGRWFVRHGHPAHRAGDEHAHRFPLIVPAIVGRLQQVRDRDGGLHDLALSATVTVRSDDTGLGHAIDTFGIAPESMATRAHEVIEEAVRAAQLSDGPGALAADEARRRCTIPLERLGLALVSLELTAA